MLSNTDKASFAARLEKLQEEIQAMFELTIGLIEKAGSPAPVYQLSTTMVVGSPSSVTAGFRTGKWGSSMADTDFDGLIVDRVYMQDIDNDGDPGGLLKFAGDVQYGNHTSIWVKYGAEDYLEYVWNGSTHYVLATDTAHLSAFNYLVANDGQTIDVIIEAR